jgi:hypothetical protein
MLLIGHSSVTIVYLHVLLLLLPRALLQFLHDEAAKLARYQSSLALTVRTTTATTAKSAAAGAGAAAVAATAAAATAGIPTVCTTAAPISTKAIL